jgi:hypothetical protein
MTKRTLVDFTLSEKESKVLYYFIEKCFSETYDPDGKLTMSADEYLLMEQMQGLIKGVAIIT